MFVSVFLNIQWIYISYAYLNHADIKLVTFAID